MDMLQCQGDQNIGLSNHICDNVYDHNARRSQTDRQTDEHRDNSATIGSNERIAR